ncbi:ATP synthase F1 subunit gamma [candidate division CPR3 bacterium GWF2_35_18]|uniref:ATP synthase gamma chain n=1 Tax=candidate division CPR3 bacterium GW2011_GWF2_35_18 TaxID=1618350 RepID=A0A0G0BL33_UNCC3|nr:MAG: ATP synthase F1, gamma subunit [candidate division CPR3 bacterium GW2011_GWF2_35_18]OGB63414.1 MAG: ATP synthase F1 subunit gamma [candidate division CPR3 bacterium GWF2_35_18]OGB64841.1 MAG: ATP synthase F1 subunit gamma [candidate division CPR3 bacterium RIFOXYA2_FULL_35_13]OGB75981.1 MAG: ATP synthase F1 subunit gamma [candidate division CPR3 bacterium RIFOXYC2_FULL_35_7]OGB78998.1 MAG: ATP synthase F1 subunit gamma [candidate division CPR3 bacterium RIFOXYB2_FULL_35_8]
MATEKEIRRRIKSAKNIKKITRAMQMVAASKMKKAQDKALAGKVYANIIFHMAGDLAQRGDSTLHPLLIDIREKKNRRLIILISTNKGLCGALNTNLFRFVENWEKNEPGIENDFVTIGKKGQPFVVYLKDQYIADFSKGNSFIENVSAVIRLVEEKFILQEYDEVWIAYSDFKNALIQKPVMKRLLPISLQELLDETKVLKYKTATGAEKKEISPEVFKAEKREEEDFVIEPSIKTLLDALLNSYLEIQLRDAIYEAEASEYSARMVAMKNATDNAGDLIEGLTLEYNKARQAGITNELLDITTAKLGLEG